MFADFGALRRGAKDWVSESTGLTTIWANVNAAHPPYPYATVNIVNGPTPLMGVWNEAINSAGDTITRDALVEFVFSVNIYSEDHAPAAHAQQYAQLAIGNLTTDDRKGKLAAAGLLRASTVPTIQNLDFSEDANRYVTRAQFDISFTAKAEVTESGTYIESVEWRNVNTDGGGNTVADETRTTTL